MRRWWKYLVGTAVVVLLVLGARVIHDVTHPPEKGARAVADHPMPAMFDQAVMTPYTGGLNGQSAEAAKLMQAWWSSHGTRSQDHKFVTWLKTALPAPPSADSRKAETSQLVKLAKTRNPQGTTAAHWLQDFGPRELWLYYAQSQAGHMPKAEKRSRHRQVSKLMTLSKKVGNSLNKRLQQPAPFVMAPELRPAKKVAAGKTCPCSYPAGADASSAAARTLLSYLYPGQADVYRHMNEEFDFAQMYLGFRLPSDVRAGTLLGDMLGEYFLVTRHDGSLQQVTAAVAKA